MFHCVLVAIMEPSARPAGQDGGPMVVPAQMQSPPGQGELNQLFSILHFISVHLDVIVCKFTLYCWYIVLLCTQVYVIYCFVVSYSCMLLLPLATTNSITVTYTGLNSWTRC